MSENHVPQSRAGYSGSNCPQTPKLPFGTFGTNPLSVSHSPFVRTFGTNPPLVSHSPFAGPLGTNPHPVSQPQFVSFGGNTFPVAQSQFGSFGNNPSQNSAFFASQPVYGATSGGNVNSGSFSNPAADGSTYKFGQPSPLRPQLSEFSSGKSDAQKPQAGPGNPNKRHMQAEDQPSFDPSHAAAPPNKLPKREPRDESRIRDTAKANSPPLEAPVKTPATNTNTPDVVSLKSSTITRELQSFSVKFKELQEGLEQRDKAILKRRELIAHREEERQKRSTRRVMCLNRLKEVYAELDKIQTEEDDLEEQCREKLEKLEKILEDSD